MNERLPIQRGSCTLVGNCTEHPEYERPGLQLEVILDCSRWQEHLAAQAGDIERINAIIGCPAATEQILTGAGIEFEPYRKQEAHA